MSFESRMSGSIHGREFGLQRMSSVEMGSSFPGVFLVGSEAIRQNVATADTTAGILRPFGLSVLSTGSSAVHTLGPPIPGIVKTIISSGGATAFVKTRNAETIETTAGSSFTTLRFLNAALVELVGLTTARWFSNLTTGQGIGMTTTT